MCTGLESGQGDTVALTVWGAAPPSRITTTLYEVRTALQDGVGPDDDALVMATVVYLLRSGWLTGLGKQACEGIFFARAEHFAPRQASL
jgi:hypothetical protein